MGDRKAERFVALRFVGKVEKQGGAGDVNDFAGDDVEDGQIMVSDIGGVGENEGDGEVANTMFLRKEDGIILEGVIESTSPQLCEVSIDVVAKMRRDEEGDICVVHTFFFS